MVHCSSIYPLHLSIYVLNQPKKQDQEMFQPTERIHMLLTDRHPAFDYVTL